MKRSGFSMIELIFVIVILGILAAVALPKFIGVGTQAHTAKVVDFVGSLNRTVMPQLWSKAISEGHNGDITQVVSSKTDLEKYTQLPRELTEVNMSRAGTSYAVIWGPTPTPILEEGSTDVYFKSYAILCTKGDSVSVPHCNAYLSIETPEQLVNEAVTAVANQKITE